ncbi:MAG: heme-binding protein [Pseudomonadota bacterium]
MRVFQSLAVFVIATSLHNTVSAQETQPVLSAASASAIVAGCDAYAKERGWEVNIAVMDQGRNLMAFLRMDGAPLGSLEISQWKANASSSFPRPTKGAADRARELPAIAAAPNIAIFEGGEPIFADDGTHLGGVGVSGVTGAQDAECARAGIEAAGLSHERGED